MQEPAYLPSAALVECSRSRYHGAVSVTDAAVSAEPLKDIVMSVHHVATLQAVDISDRNTIGHLMVLIGHHEHRPLRTAKYRRVVVTNEQGLTRIPMHFLADQNALEYVDLGRLGAVTSIGFGVLADCPALGRVNFCAFTNVVELDTHFLARCGGLQTLDLTPLVNLVWPSIENLRHSLSHLCFYSGVYGASPLHTVTLPLVFEARLRVVLRGDQWVEAERTATAVVMMRRGVARRERKDADDGSRDAGPAAKKGHRTERHY